MSVIIDWSGIFLESYGVAHRNKKVLENSSKKTSKDQEYAGNWIHEFHEFWEHNSGTTWFYESTTGH